MLCYYQIGDYIHHEVTTWQVVNDTFAANINVDTAIHCYITLQTLQPQQIQPCNAI